MISPSYTEVRDAAVLPDFKARNSSLKLLKVWPRHDFNLKKYLVKSRFLVCLRFFFLYGEGFLPVCRHMYHMHVWCLCRPHGVRSPETQVTDGS